MYGDWAEESIQQPNNRNAIIKYFVILTPVLEGLRRKDAVKITFILQNFIVILKISNVV